VVELFRDLELEEELVPVVLQDLPEFKDLKDQLVQREILEHRVEVFQLMTDKRNREVVLTFTVLLENGVAGLLKMEAVAEVSTFSEEVD
jgi:hypothetical protein